MNKRQSKKNHVNMMKHCYMLECSQELRIFDTAGLKQSEIERVKKFFRRNN